MLLEILEILGEIGVAVQIPDYLVNAQQKVAAARQALKTAEKELAAAEAQFENELRQRYGKLFALLERSPQRSRSTTTTTNVKLKLIIDGQAVQNARLDSALYNRFGRGAKKALLDQMASQGLRFPQSPGEKIEVEFRGHKVTLVAE